MVEGKADVMEGEADVVEVGDAWELDMAEFWDARGSKMAGGFEDDRRVRR
jgi:hypothetical protein